MTGRAWQRGCVGGISKDPFGDSQRISSRIHIYALVIPNAVDLHMHVGRPRGPRAHEGWALHRKPWKAPGTSRLGSAPCRASRPGRGLQELGLKWSDSKALRTKRLVEYFTAHPRRVVEAAAPEMDPKDYQTILGNPSGGALRISEVHPSGKATPAKSLDRASRWG